MPSRTLHDDCTSSVRSTTLLPPPARNFVLSVHASASNSFVSDGATSHLLVLPPSSQLSRCRHLKVGAPSFSVFPPPPTRTRVDLIEPPSPNHQPHSRSTFDATTTFEQSMLPSIETTFLFGHYAYRLSLLSVNATYHTGSTVLKVVISSPKVRSGSPLLSRLPLTSFLPRQATRSPPTPSFKIGRAHV